MILQIGNKLGKKGKSESFMESLDMRLVGEGFEILTLSDKKNYLFRMMDMILSVIKYRNKTELIIIHAFSTFAFWYAFFVSSAAKLLKLPFILVLHGGDFPNRIKRSPYACKYIFRNADLIITPSEYLQKAVNAFGFQVFYLPNFIDISEYAFETKDNKQLNILWVRAFNKMYNPALFIEIILQLMEKGYKVRSAMVGPDSDGTMMEILKKIAESKLEDHIIITGRLEKKEWVELSKGYNYFVNTTNYDNRPISLIEAMALGLPVISTNVGGLPTLIKHNENGILVDPNNANLFVDEIMKLYDDNTSYKSIARNARKYVEQFDWENVRKDWISLINKNKRQVGN